MFAHVCVAIGPFFLTNTRCVDQLCFSAHDLVIAPAAAWCLVLGVLFLASGSNIFRIMTHSILRMMHQVNGQEFLPAGSILGRRGI